MQTRILKAIPATVVTGFEVRSSNLLTSVEMRALETVSVRFARTLELRRVGLTPQEISRLEFLRWMQLQS